MRSRWRVAASDINGDGKVDLIVTNTTPNVGVLLGNGNGSFQPQLTFGVSGVAAAIAVSDVNRDGRADLVVGNRNTGNVSVLLGDAPPVVLSINRANPSGPDTTASSVNYLVTFSKPVSGVDASDFTLALNGVSTAYAGDCDRRQRDLYGDHQWGFGLWNAGAKSGG